MVSDPVSSLKRASTSWAAHAWLVFQKDLRIELRTGEIVITGSFFAVLVTVIASLSFYTGPTTRNQVAAGVIWLATCFAAVLALSRSWQREREEGMLDALLVSPLPPSALYMGKALGVLAFLGVVELIVIPTCALFFALELGDYLGGLGLICLAATPGVAAAGTLFGVMTVRTKARDLVLSVVLFPLLSPTLLGAAVATRELLGGTPLPELLDYVQIMFLFDFVFVIGGLGLFGSLAEQ
jgi:heme exporter protein B